MRIPRDQIEQDKGGSLRTTVSALPVAQSCHGDAKAAGKLLLPVAELIARRGHAYGDGVDSCTPSCCPRAWATAPLSPCSMPSNALRIFYLVIEIDTNSYTSRARACRFAALKFARS